MGKETENQVVDKAWAQFCGGIGRGPDAPYHGMIEAFEHHYGQTFTDKDWRNETGIWAAAWGYATRQAERKIGAAAEPPIQWPKARDVGRYGDMSKESHIRVGLDSDNDVYVSVWDGAGGATVEFCSPGAGGGKSNKTRTALIALMVAMEADNTEIPRLDWWARRNGTAKG